MCYYNAAQIWFCIRESCCVRLFHLKLHPKAQRSHVICLCSTILLTFSSVKAGGDRPWLWNDFRAPMPGGDTEPRPGLTAKCCVLTAPAPPCVLHAVASLAETFCRSCPLFNHNTHLQDCTVSWEHNVLRHAWYGYDSVRLQADLCSRCTQ